MLHDLLSMHVAACDHCVLLLSSTQLRVIEDEIGAGQVEELIEQAKDELELIPQYAGESLIMLSCLGCCHSLSLWLAASIA